MMTNRSHKPQTKFFRNNIYLMKVAMVLYLFVTFFFGCTKNKPELVPIRIGWQVAWAVEGQIAQCLKHTNILELNGLKGEFMGFTYGAPLNEAALAGEIDVGFVADQLAVSLIARGGKFKVVSRLMDFRAAIIAPAESDINQVSDLKGKTLAIPFGSTTHRVVLGMLKDAGLDTSKDVHIINMDISEQAGIVLSGTKKQWQGNIDALASWDPNIAIFESKGLAKLLKSELALAIVYMSEDFINKHPDSAKSFLKSLIESYYYYALNQRLANQWYVEEARIQFDPSLLDISASFEPNLRAKNIKDIDINIDDHHLAMMQEGAEFAFNIKLTSVIPNMKSATNSFLLSKAMIINQEKPIDFSKIRVQ